VIKGLAAHLAWNILLWWWFWHAVLSLWRAGPLASMFVLLQLTPDGKQRADTLPSDIETVTGAQNLASSNAVAAENAKVRVWRVHGYVCCLVVSRKLLYSYMRLWSSALWCHIVRQIGTSILEEIAASSLNCVWEQKACKLDSGQWQSTSKFLGLKGLGCGVKHRPKHSATVKA
jgi:hypothetical protein